MCFAFRGTSSRYLLLTSSLGHQGSFPFSARGQASVCGYLVEATVLEKSSEHDAATLERTCIVVTGMSLALELCMLEQHMLNRTFLSLQCRVPPPGLTGWHLWLHNNACVNTDTDHTLTHARRQTLLL